MLGYATFIKIFYTSIMLVKNSNRIHYCIFIRQGVMICQYLMRERKKIKKERRKIPVTGMTEVLLDPGMGDFKSVGKKRVDR